MTSGQAIMKTTTLKSKELGLELDLISQCTILQMDRKRDQNAQRQEVKETTILKMIQSSFETLILFKKFRSRFRLAQLKMQMI